MSREAAHRYSDLRETDYNFDSEDTMYEVFESETG